MVLPRCHKVWDGCPFLFFAFPLQPYCFGVGRVSVLFLLSPLLSTLAFLLFVFVFVALIKLLWRG